MKRPRKVTPETRPNQYARKIYGKKKLLQEENWDAKEKSAKKIKRHRNKKIRHMKHTGLPENGGIYKKESSDKENQ